jgi:RNA polymerase sigma-70 factor, ECF subfamily
LGKLGTIRSDRRNANTLTARRRIHFASARRNRHIPLSANHFRVLSLRPTSGIFLALFSLVCRTAGEEVFIMETVRVTSRSENSDGALVAAAKRGDTQAFEELVRRYTQRVLAVAQRITKNREDAEDVAQDSFQKAFLHLDDFEEKSRFSTWLTRIVLNEAFALLRRRRGVFEVWPGSPDDEMKTHSEAFVDKTPTPEESCWRRERTDYLTEAIDRLGPKVRTTILLRHMEERTVEETARILGTSITAVKARLFQGRRKLRRTLNPGFLQGVCPAGRPEAQHC